MKFKLPNLGKLVSTDKKLDKEAPSRLIHVINGKAIVINKIAAVVDIYEYVKKECSLTEDSDFEMLKGILEWMEGKSFTKEYWANLIKECYSVLTNEGIQVEYPSYNLTLEWDEIHTDNATLLSVLKDNINRPAETLERTAIKGELLTLFNETFKKELAKDSLLLEFTNGVCVKYSGRSKDYIYGYIPLAYEDGAELTAFMNTAEFVRELEG